MNQARSLALWAAALLSASGATAQGVDPTPGTTPAIELDGSVGPGGDVPFDGTTWQIGDDLGEYGNDGANLFHSFGRFGVPPGQAAEFSAANGSPERVLARVTWGELSVLEGIVRSTIPGADLILINPAGIRFQGGASVDVQGSFYATTAESVNFGPSERFEAYAGGAPVLAVDPPSAFGFLPELSAVVFSDLDAGLSVPEGETLAAVAGRVDVLGGGSGVYRSSGSRLALVAGGPEVEVPFDLESFSPGEVDPALSLGEVVIEDARIDVLNPRGGSVLVRGQGLELKEATSIRVVHNDARPNSFANAIDVDVRGTVSIADGSLVTVAATDAKAGGDARIRAGGSIDLRSGSGIRVLSNDLAPSPDLFLEAGDSVSLSDAAISSESLDAGEGGEVRVIADRVELSAGGRIQATASGSAPGGRIHVDAGELEVSDAGFSALGTQIATETSSGDPAASAGDIELRGGLVRLRDGGKVFSSTSGAADSGRIDVRVAEVEVGGTSAMDLLVRSAGIEVRALDGSTGRAGRVVAPGVLEGVTVDVDRLRVEGGGFVGTITEGTGAAGDVIVVADSFELEGGEAGPAVLISRTLGSPAIGDGGDGGGIVIEAAAVSLRNGGQVTVASRGTGGAGSISIDADRVDIEGTIPGAESGLFAQTLAQDGGAGGTVRAVVDGDIRLTDGARIGVETRGAGNAGDVELDAGGQVVVAGGSIATFAAPGSTGAPGSISIQADGGVFLSAGAEISARAFGDAAAGTIDIDAGPRLELRDSTITTESRTSTNPGGGQITIVARDEVRLTDSSIDTSVALGAGDGGDLRIDPKLVVVNRSDILANAQDGDGGRIFIRAGAFVASTGSRIQASSLGAGSGVDGEVIIESPDANLTSETASPPPQYLDAAGLLKNACSAAGASQSSLVVARVAGLPATPEGPLPSRLWDDSWVETRVAAR